MPSQRPFFLSSFLAAFRQQSPSIASQQPNKHGSTPAPSSSAYSPGSSAPRTISGPATAAAAAAAAAASSQQQQAQQSSRVASHLPLHSPRSHQATANSHGAGSSGAGAGAPGGIPIPIPGSGRRRGSDSSSEGFREVLGADKWYIGGRTAAGEEKFFKLGVVRRVRSGDRLSLDRLSL